MKLYDDIINKCLNLLENTNMTTYKKKDISSWDIENEHKIILRSDMAYELGGMMMPRNAYPHASTRQAMADAVPYKLTASA